MSQRPDADQTTTGARLDGGRRCRSSRTGPVFWRSLEELAAGGVPAVPGEHDHDRATSRAVAGDPQPPRLLPLMAASLALGGLTGCAIEPSETIVPYVEQPEQIVPGKPLFFATALATDGFGLGVLVESHMGRPTKIEGNPDHPASLGATDAFAQAAILDFYDPDRSQVVTHGRPRRDLGALPGDAPAGLRERKREDQGRRPADPDPDGDLADPGRPAPPAARAVPRGEVARLRAGHARRRPRRRRSWPSARSSSRSITSTRPT